MVEFIMGFFYFGCILESLVLKGVRFSSYREYFKFSQLYNSTFCNKTLYIGEIFLLLIFFIFNFFLYFVFLEKRS